jgi:hypothetical protein
VPGMGELVVAIATFLVLAVGLAFTIYEVPRLVDQAERDARSHGVRIHKLVFKSAPREAPVFQPSLARQEERNSEARDCVITQRFRTERAAQLTIRLDAASSEKVRLRRELEKTRAQLQSTMRDLETAKQQQSFIASEGDIRDLMGARQLYIADVGNVNQDSESGNAFGRVFYTEGKVLIFYAFDLDCQPDVTLTKTFQAWGHGDSDSSNPVSLGMFYMDSEPHRRWLLKSQDSNVLAQISTVFVTAEPNSGSWKPSGKPFLFAYLGSRPRDHS